jgi:hypothetical protein
MHGHSPVTGIYFLQNRITKSVSFRQVFFGDRQAEESTRFHYLTPVLPPMPRAEALEIAELYVYLDFALRGLLRVSEE